MNKALFSALAAAAIAAPLPALAQPQSLFVPVPVPPTIAQALAPQNLIVIQSDGGVLFLGEYASLESCIIAGNAFAQKYNKATIMTVLVIPKDIGCYPK